MPVGAIRVEGLAELNRAFRQVENELSKELQTGLKKVAEPVRTTAERLAGSEIHNILSPTAEVDWWRMKIGVTAKIVYIAPQMRRRGGSPRPNLAPLLLRKAMQPALDENEDAIVRGVEETLNRVITAAGF